MTCTICTDSLSALMDGELAPSSLADLRRHLMECPDCARECAAFCCQQAAARLLAVPEPPAGLWERIEVRLRAPGAEAEILTLEEAAAYLRVTVEHLYEALGSIPHVRIGDAVRIHGQSLAAWARGTVPVESTARSNVVDMAAARSRLTRMGRR